MTINPPSRPRVGIPWRTTQEESQENMDKLGFYFDRIREAGGEPKHISLRLLAEDLRHELGGFEAFVLPGSPADVDPVRYGAIRHQKSVTLDAHRDTTDLAVLAHAQRTGKPVLAICYGCQILNVFFHGTLLQDIASENPGSLKHGKTDLAASATSGDLEHAIQINPASHLARLVGRINVGVNSSHHQAIDRPGEGLKVTARSSDGIVEAVELQSSLEWIVGVQWHPERMPDDPLSRKLFEDFVSAARAHAAVPAGQ